jgi:hypothetical protein
MQYVFIHGLGQKPSSWDNVVSQMAEPANIVCSDLLSLIIGKDTTYPNLYRSFANYCHGLTQNPNSYF